MNPDNKLKYNAIKSLLNDNRSTDKEYITHVSQDTNFLGSFTLSRMLICLFYNLYCSFVFENDSAIISIAEQSKDYSVTLCIDIDRKVKNYEKVEELYSDSEILETVKQIQTLLKANSICNDKNKDNLFDCVVLKKKPYISSDNYLKNGIHLQFINFVVEPGINRKLLFEKLKLEVSDEIDLTFNSPWLLYGSCKNLSTGSYKVKYIIDTNSKIIDDHQSYFSKVPIYNEKHLEIEKTKPIEYYYPQILSIKNIHNKNSIDLKITKQNNIDLNEKLELDFANREQVDKDWSLYKNEILFSLEEYLSQEGLDLEIENSNSTSIHLKNSVGYICPFTKKEHKRNHAYCTIFQGKLFFGCYAKCETDCGKKMICIGKYREDKKENEEKEAFNKNKIDYLFNTNCKNKINTNERFVNCNNFLSSRCTLIKAGLGKGKSTAVSNFINNSDFESIIVITPRITYAKSVIERLKADTGIDFKLYSKIKGFIEDKFVVIQVESLHRLNFNFKNSLVVLDECESIFNQITSAKTQGKNIIENVTQFEYLLTTSKKLILLDAFVSQRSIKTLEILKISFKFFNYIQPYEKRNCIRSKSMQDMIPRLIKDLEEGKKIYFVSSSKNAITGPLGIISKVQSILPETKILQYHSDHHDDLNDVNQSWKKADLIITTTTLTVGVNFDEIGIFDKVYVYMGATSQNLVRDIFQSTYRIRNLKDCEMIYCIDGRRNGIPPLATTKNEISRYITDKENLIAESFEQYAKEKEQAITPKFLRELIIYNKFEANLSIMNLEDLFYRYLLECGYTHKDDNLIVEIDWKEIEIKDEIKYEDIPKIDSDKFAELREKKNNKTATNIEILSIEKFFFRKSIILNDENEAIVWSIWRNFGKGKFRNLQIEKGLNEGSLRINELLLTTEYAGLSDCLAVRTELIQKICKWLGIKNSCDYEAVISKEKLDSVLENFKYNKERLNIAFELRDRSTLEDFDYKHCIELINKIFSKWCYSKIKVSKDRKQKRVGKTRVDITPFVVENKEQVNLYDYISPKSIRPSLPVDFYEGEGVPL